MALIAACQSKPVGQVALSERFNVCAVLPRDASFQPGEPGPDFDLGVLRAHGMMIEVQIGGHPRFSHRVVKTGVRATAGFEFLGSERSDGQEKYLFANARGDEEGPMYVMFMAPDSRAHKYIPPMKDWLISCKMPKANRRRLI
ncbi:hypothetical protein HF319_01290 [Xanthomonas sp. Kuri4-1]